MFGDAFSAAWLMLGYLALLILLGTLVFRFGRMKGITTAPGYLGAVFWIIGVIVYLIFARVGEPDAIILNLVSIVAPMVHFFNILGILLERKHKWKDPDYKRKGLRYLLIFLGAVAVYAIGLVLA